MTKAWQEAVTQRLVLWRRAGSAGGAVQGQVEGVSRGHVCRWVKPLVPAEDEFVVRGDGIKVL